MPVDEILAELLTPDGHEHLDLLYGQLHQAGEVHRSQFLGRLLTSHRHCDAVLRDGRTRRARDERLPGRGGRPAAELINRTFMMMDPPDHTRIRRLVSKAFTPRAISGLQPAIEKVLTGLVDRMAERAGDGDQVDLMNELAFPFPVAVIGELIGVPAADQAQFQGLVRDLTRVVEIMADDADLVAADTAAGSIIEYFEDLVAARRRTKADDLVSALIAARDDDDRLTEDELVATLTLLFVAGFETTTNLIGNGMMALLDHPDQLSALRREPATMPAAVEELLRFDTPVQMITRVTAEPIALADGTVLPADRHLVIMLGAANRDPQVYAEPDRLRLNRSEAPVLTFGSGIHYCLGAGLARLEACLLFTELLERFRVIELGGVPQRRASLTVRGFAHLPLRLTTG